jgi:hypothetical protein
MEQYKIKATDKGRILYNWYNMSIWRDGRVVEGARLESVYASNRIAGSNPVLSATLNNVRRDVI